MKGEVITTHRGARKEIEWKMIDRGNFDMDKFLQHHREKAAQAIANKIATDVINKLVNELK